MAAEPHPDVIAALSDDLNTPSAISIIHGIAKSAARNAKVAASLKASLQFLGIYGDETQVDFAVGYEVRSVDGEKVGALIAARNAARKAKELQGGRSHSR